METTYYCVQCGAARPSADLVPPCPTCGARRTTRVAPSQEPCAYCGARPTSAVVWIASGQTSQVWLCAACDAAETEALRTET